ncbi:hypothetical protein VB636_01655 [Paracoccus sp. APAP_BH8]|nr:hypothetical protein [Paracoccus pantotrophus]
MTGTLEIGRNARKATKPAHGWRARRVPDSTPAAQAAWSQTLAE